MQVAERRALIERLEILAREQPGTYRLRVIALALVGLSYRWLVSFTLLSVPVVLTLAFYPVKWALVLLGILLLVFGTLSFRQPKIDGERLHAHDAPELFAALEAMRLKLRAPRVHEVVLSREFNASAAQIPRLGALGWHKQVLTLGIPLLAALSREQVLAVIGHELGHFSKAHARLGQWIYRTRWGWERMRARFAGESGGLAGAANQFYLIFVPYFSAYSFVLARLCEYEADADSAAACDAATAGSALAAVHAYGRFINQRFWPALWRSALRSPEPPQDVFARLAEAARTAPARDLAAFREEALRRTSDLADTHPCLTDRLRALRASDVPLTVVEACAGRAFLGPGWDGVLERASADWCTKTSADWRDHHHRLQTQTQRLSELRAAPASLEARLEIAGIIHSIDGVEAALEHWRALRDGAPGDVRIDFAWAKALARAKQTEAFALLDALAVRAPGYSLPAFQICKQLALDVGDSAAADRYEARLRSARRKEEALTPKFVEAIRRGAFAQHGIPDHAIALLTRQLQSDNIVAGAYVAAVRCPEAEGFGAVYLMIRIDPEAMRKAVADPDGIAERCRSLLESMLQPNELIWVENFYTSEPVAEMIARGLSALERGRLYGDLGHPEGLRIDPRSIG